MTMQRHILYSYRNIQEFNKFYEEVESKGEEITSILTDDIAGFLITDDVKIIMDIGPLLEYTKQNPGNKYFYINALSHANPTSQFIININLIKDALQIFNHLFLAQKPLFENDEENDISTKIIPYKRKTIYTYINGVDLDFIIQYCNDKDIPFTNFNKINGHFNSIFREICSEDRTAIIDLSGIVMAVKSNPQFIYLAEQLFDSFPYYNAVVRKDLVEDALEYYCLTFSNFKPITDLYTEMVLPSDSDLQNEDKEKKVTRIIDFDADKLSNLFYEISTKLIGHKNFKSEIEVCIRNFLIHNKLGEKKILSIFLLGDSGLGKTEVARIIKNVLNEKASFIKISFGNYSSKDALNNLIGSPKGYIGCEDGELAVKLNKSKAGIVLCDEFEKATRPVYNFFLELLEDGTFTDSMSREYDLDGYIIIFTSNINKEEFFSKIPSELQSRMDLVCEFVKLTAAEKKEFIKYQVKDITDKLISKMDYKFSPEDIRSFENIDISATDNLRDLKRITRNKVFSHIGLHVR